MGTLGKKLRASTLMETLIATVIILAVFMIASLVLNTVFKGLMTNDRFDLDNRVSFITYQYTHNQITLPYSEDFDHFELYISRDTEDSIDYILIEITDKESEESNTIRYIDENK